MAVELDARAVEGREASAFTAAGGSMAPVILIASGAPTTYADAVEGYLVAAGVAASSQRIYRITLNHLVLAVERLRELGRQLAGDHPPTSRRGARPPSVPLAVLDDPDIVFPLANVGAGVHFGGAAVGALWSAFWTRRVGRRAPLRGRPDGGPAGAPDREGFHKRRARRSPGRRQPLRSRKT